MLQAFEAVIDERGQVRLGKEIDLPALRRAIVIVLDEPPVNIRDTAGVPKPKYTKKQGQSSSAHDRGPGATRAIASVAVTGGRPKASPLQDSFTRVGFP